MPKMDRLVCIDLSHNRLSEEPRGRYDPSGWQAFTSNIQESKSFTCMRVSNTRLGNDEVSRLMECGAQIMTLRSIDLSDNFIHAAGNSAKSMKYVLTPI